MILGESLIPLEPPFLTVKGSPHSNTELVELPEMELGWGPVAVALSADSGTWSQQGQGLRKAWVQRCIREWEKGEVRGQVWNQKTWYSRGHFPEPLALGLYHPHPFLAAFGRHATNSSFEACTLSPFNPPCGRGQGRLHTAVALMPLVKK